MKKTTVRLSPDAEEAYKELNLRAKTSKVEKSILTSIKKKIELIKDNPHYGVSVPKKMIPKKYITEYEINNLFVVKLSSYWRMLYTLANNGSIEIISFVLDIISHPDYDKI